MKMKEFQCQICWSMVFEGDERCIVHTDEDTLESCILCGAAAERLGWWITV
jgi:hypothetical protein